MGFIFPVRAFLTYWLDAVDAHSLHSPFFYDFYRQVIREGERKNYEEIEPLRRALLANPEQISFDDAGAKSKHFSSTTRTIRHIAKTSMAPATYARLYDRILDHFQHKTIFELGTSFGITTLYLARGPGRTVTTFEGVAPIASIAKQHFSRTNNASIRLIEGNLDTTLPQASRDIRRLDFVLMDANHRLEPTLRYFNHLLPALHTGSVVVVDDIHESEEMETAWNTIRRYQQVYGSIDLFRAGILFFDPSLNKQHVVLQF